MSEKTIRVIEAFLERHSERDELRRELERADALPVTARKPQREQVAGSDHGEACYLGLSQRGQEAAREWSTPPGVSTELSPSREGPAPGMMNTPGAIRVTASP